MKKSTDTIGSRIRDLPVCSAVPQPTAPPPQSLDYFFKFPSYNTKCELCYIISFNNEMGGACGMYEGRNLRERDPLEDLGVGERILLKWIFKKQNECMDRTDVAQDRDNW
jgi:hypothetical protein